MGKTIWSEGPGDAVDSGRYAEPYQDDVDDIEWPCYTCGETGSACECTPSSSCEECGESWRYCECEHEV